MMAESGAGLATIFRRTAIMPHHHYCRISTMSDSRHVHRHHARVMLGLGFTVWGLGTSEGFICWHVGREHMVSYVPHTRLHLHTHHLWHTNEEASLLREDHLAHSMTQRTRTPPSFRRACVSRRGGRKGGWDGRELWRGARGEDQPGQIAEEK